MTTLMHFTSAVGNHLWQSTVLAAVAWLLTLALRKNQARTRYWLWMVASVKFLVPFSCLVALGGYLRAMIATPMVSRPELSALMEQVTTPFPQPEFASAIASSSLEHNGGAWPMVLLALWTCGFVFVALSWGRKWWRVRAAVRSASRSALIAGVPVLSSQSLLEPGIFGVFRPVLMLPEGITERLTPAQVDAIVAHEMCHVRRRDNLTAAIHMLVEAAFWFHPLVWRIGSRMVEERERACDEEVLRLGGDPEIYAEGILNVCKFYVESPLTCVSGISGSDLKKRIVRIMTERVARKLDFSRKLLLGVAAVLAAAMPIVFGLINAPQLRAQSGQTASGPLPSFEVASIKHDHSQADHSGANLIRVGGPDASRWTASNLTAKMLVTFAYNIKDFQVSGGPSWINSDRFDIDAKVEDSLAAQMQKLPRMQQQDQMRLMVRSLLADRFKLAVSHDTKELPVYELVIAKGGPKLKESAPPDAQNSAAPAPPPASAGSALPTPPRGGFMMSVGRGGEATLTSKGAPIANLVSLLSQQVGRQIVDQTGLKGEYDISLKWTSDSGLGGGPLPAAPDSTSANDVGGTSIFTALQDQLGLRLESTKGPVDTIVIDHIEEPSEN
jgi:bla regulator protein blaR1